MTSNVVKTPFVLFLRCWLVRILAPVGLDRVIWELSFKKKRWGTAFLHPLRRGLAWAGFSTGEKMETLLLSVKQKLVLLNWLKGEAKPQGESPRDKGTCADPGGRLDAQGHQQQKFFTSATFAHSYTGREKKVLTVNNINFRFIGK